MLDTILSWIIGIIAQGCNFFIRMFLNAMSLDLKTIVECFGFLLTGYRIFQVIGVGLILLIAAFQLSKFFLGNLSSLEDTPLQLMFRVAIAGMLIFFGNHIVELLVDIARYPYQSMISASISGEGIDFVGFLDRIKDGVVNDVSNLGHWAGVVELIGTGSWTGVALSAAAVSVVAIVLLIVIVWNLIKLALEICERYLMIGVLVFSSPLVYSTFSSKRTVPIFQKWVSMLISQCAIMTLSSWMLKIILSGLASNGGAPILLQLMLVLAMCKVAQRLDEYMMQLGLNAAKTGGNLLDDVFALGKMAGNIGGAFTGSSSGGGGGGSGGSGGGAVLGALGAASSNNGPIIKASDPSLGGVINSWRNAHRLRMAGATKAEQHHAMTEFMRGPGIKNIQSVVNKAGGFVKGNRLEAVKAATGAWKDNWGNNFHTTGKNFLSTFGRGMEAGFSTLSVLAGGKAFAAGAPSIRNSNYVPKSTSTKDNVSGIVKSMSEIGQANRPIGTFERDKDNQLRLNDTAAASGLAIKDGRLDGDMKAQADFISKNYANAANDAEMNEILMNTVKNDPELAEVVLQNPNNDLAGNDGLGNALMTAAFLDEATIDNGTFYSNIRTATNSNGVRAIYAEEHNSHDENLVKGNRNRVITTAAGINGPDAFTEDRSKDSKVFVAKGSGVSMLQYGMNKNDLERMSGNQTAPEAEIFAPAMVKGKDVAPGAEARSVLFDKKIKTMDDAKLNEYIDSGFGAQLKENGKYTDGQWSGYQKLKNESNGEDYFTAVYTDASGERTNVAFFQNSYVNQHPTDTSSSDTITQTSNIDARAGYAFRHNNDESDGTSDRP